MLEENGQPYAAGVLFGAADMSQAQFLPVTISDGATYGFGMNYTTALPDIGDGVDDFATISLDASFLGRVDIYFAASQQTLSRYVTQRGGEQCYQLQRVLLSALQGRATSSK